MRVVVGSSAPIQGRVWRIGGKRMRYDTDDEDKTFCHGDDEVSSSDVGGYDDIDTDQDVGGEVSSSGVPLLNDTAAVPGPASEPCERNDEVTSSDIPMHDSSLESIISEIVSCSIVQEAETFETSGATTVTVAACELVGNDDADDVIVEFVRGGNIVVKNAREDRRGRKADSCRSSKKAKRNHKQKGHKKKMPKPVAEQEEWEVEAIRDYKALEMGGQYLVKWKNWGEKDNTWEPISNLHSCSQVLTRFYLEQREAYYESLELGGRRHELPVLPPDPRTIEEIIEEFTNEFPVTEDQIEVCIRKYGAKLQEPKLSKQEISRLVAQALHEVLPLDKRRYLEVLVAKYEVHNRYVGAQETLKEWKSVLNFVTKGRPNIEVENHVDLVGAPDFVYLKESRISCDVQPSQSPACPCEGYCYHNKSNCSSGVDRNEFAYNALKRVVVPPGYPIFECHSACQCTKSCPNRVVGNGYENMLGMSFCIFRMMDKGWGVKTLKPIRKGSFVMLIVGEIVMAEEAFSRQMSSDDEIGKYVFPLETYTERKYSIDFTKMGNLSHFINHSCKPNLSIYPNWYGHTLGGLPRIALFASKDIPTNTELTYSYVDMKAFRQACQPDKFTACPQGFQPCLCGSADCVRYMLFPD